MRACVRASERASVCVFVCVCVCVRERERERERQRQRERESGVCVCVCEIGRDVFTYAEERHDSPGCVWEKRPLASVAGVTKTIGPIDGRKRELGVT